MIWGPRAGNQSWKGRGDPKVKTQGPQRDGASLSPGGRRATAPEGKPTECRTHLNTTRENFRGKGVFQVLVPKQQTEGDSQPQEEQNTGKEKHSVPTTRPGCHTSTGAPGARWRHEHAHWGLCTRGADGSRN